MAEALTNVVKHSRATRAEVTGTVEDGTLRSRCATTARRGRSTGYGLLGIGDRRLRSAARMRIDSPRGAGTVLTAVLPLAQ